jgi:thiamine-phosphate diphosphorylase
VKPPLPRLHAVTDERIARRPDVTDIARQLASAGGPALGLHARGRSLTGLEHHDLAVRLSGHPARLFVNDRLDIALATNAAGVQLGTGSLPISAARGLNAHWWIGRSVHSRAEAETALAEGADYLLVGPVFATASHPGTPPLGPAVLRDIAALGAPAVAIGGITPDTARQARDAGAYGVAAIRALWDAAEPAAAARLMLEDWT